VTTSPDAPDQWDGQPELPPDVAAMSYEAARDELTDLVRRLEAGSAPLEESLALWERGELLARRCEQVLDGALARLDTTRPRAAE
jgi:exodeoxyribonuclease VII small subunit